MIRNKQLNKSGGGTRRVPPRCRNEEQTTAATQQYSYQLNLKRAYRQNPPHISPFVKHKLEAPKHHETAYLMTLKF